MRRLITLLFAVLLAVSLAACNTPTVEPVPSPSLSPTATPTPTVGAVLPDVPRDYPDEPYTPTVIDEIGTQYYGAPRYAFTPSADYGAVVPYIGGKIGRAGPDIDGPNALVGFATLDGRIICEPVYTDVSVMSDGENTVYIARKLSYINGENVREDIMIAASGAWAITANEITDGNIRRGNTWERVNFAGESYLPITSDFRIDLYTSADGGTAYLITEISDTWFDYEYDISEYYDAEPDTYYRTVYLPETLDYYLVDASGARLTETQRANYAEHEREIEYMEYYRPADALDFAFTAPDGYVRQYFYGGIVRWAVSDVFAFNWVDGQSLVCLDVDPPFTIFAADKYAETRSPDGAVIVRRAFSDSSLD
ncbi:MAG: hypothetical protein LBN02_05305 [Oscillospiraceae bacterium]|jgi:hypothetical protein|nr:hypothetical protein [Oscillospiraceae bacterium]